MREKKMFLHRDLDKEGGFEVHYRVAVGIVNRYIIPILKHYGIEVTLDNILQYSCDLKKKITEREAGRRVKPDSTIFEMLDWKDHEAIQFNDYVEYRFGDIDFARETRRAVEIGRIKDYLILEDGVLRLNLAKIQEKFSVYAEGDDEVRFIENLQLLADQMNVTFGKGVNVHYDIQKFLRTDADGKVVLRGDISKMFLTHFANKERG